MRTCGIVKFFTAVLLIILPIVIGDNGFKDYQLKIGYGIKEFRALKWLNKIIGLDRDTDSPPAPQFPPIQVHGKPFVVPPSPIAPIENPPQVSFNPSPSNNPPELSNIQTKQIAEAPQVANYTSALPSPTHDTSAKSSSVDSTEASSFFSGFKHSYKDYLYMKWFHGSPKAQYFNENPVPVPSVVDSKSEQVNYEEADDSEVNDHSPTDEQQPALFSFSGDSILSRMFNTIKRTLAVPRIQKEDIGPLKFYDEPPKPQLFSVPPPGAFPSPYNPPQSAAPTQTDQLANSYLANNPSVPVYNQPNSLPKLEEPARIVPELDTSLPVAATTFKPSILGYGLSEAPEETSTNPPELFYNLPIPVDNEPAKVSSYVLDNQPAEPSSNEPDNSQPQTTIIPIERTSVPLQTAYTNPIKRTSIDTPVQSSEEADYNALLLAYKPQIPTYA